MYFDLSLDVYKFIICILLYYYFNLLLYNIYHCNKNVKSKKIIRFII